MRSGARELGRGWGFRTAVAGSTRPSPARCLAAPVATQTRLWALPPHLRILKGLIHTCVEKVLTGLKDHREWSPTPLPGQAHGGVGT